MDFASSFANNTMLTVARIVGGLLNLYFWVVIASAVITWVRPDPYNPIVRTLRALTEPVFYQIRKAMPFTYANGMDFSPLVVLIAIELVNNILVKTLVDYARM